MDIPWYWRVSLQYLLNYIDIWCNARFQCYDKYLTEEYTHYAINSGHPEWAFYPNNTGIVHYAILRAMANIGNAGMYNSTPGETEFFTKVKGSTSNYMSDYGQFFLGINKIDNKK